MTVSLGPETALVVGSWCVGDGRDGLGCCVPLPEAVSAALGRTAFTVRGVAMTWLDVWLGALLRGEWAAVADRARLGLALEAQAAGSGVDPVSGAALDAACQEFRYDRNLVSRDEMEAWLSRWEVSAADWIAWIHRDLLRREADGAQETEGVEVSQDELGAALYHEALCAGDLERAARRLAGQAAVAEPGSQSVAGEESAADARARRFLAHLGSSGVGAETLASLGERLAVVARLDGAFRRFECDAASPEAVDAEVRSRGSDLTRVVFRTLRLPREEMAREALLSVRDDGRTLDEVAGDAGLRPSEGAGFLGDLPPPLRQRLLGARPGELRGPFARDGAFELIVVAEKEPPRTQDPRVRDRAREGLVARLVSRAVDERVAFGEIR